MYHLVVGQLELETVEKYCKYGLESDEKYIFVKKGLKFDRITRGPCIYLEKWAKLKILHIC